jgi:hypothetical protein
MSKSEEYRHKAIGCQAMAEQCKDTWSKGVWLETADTWLRMGSRAEEAVKRKSPPEAE